MIVNVTLLVMVINHSIVDIRAMYDLQMKEQLSVPLMQSRQPMMARFVYEMFNQRFESWKVSKHRSVSISRLNY